MQAEVFVQTNDRTPLQYLIKPLQDQFARAFRES
jgi:HlyD family secretion protein